MRRQLLYHDAHSLSRRREVIRAFQLARVTAISEVGLRLYEKEPGNPEEKKPKVFFIFLNQHLYPTTAT